MAYQKRAKIEAHDAAGYETDYTDFSELDDGYGNRVAHGDISVQRAVEEGCREARSGEYEEDVRATAYDKEPFMSKAQQRFMFAAEARGEIPAGTARRWAHHTKDIKHLPEYKR